MVAHIEIMCIKKNTRECIHERIRAVGGVHPNGSSWTLSQPQAISDIETRKSTFFVNVRRDRVRVVVGFSRSGHKYLKSEQDGEQPNDLLSLPEYARSF